MKFNNIYEYLRTFKNSIPKDTIIKNHLITIVNKEMNIQLKKNDIQITKNTIHLKIHPTIRSEIFLKKNTILTLLNTQLTGITTIQSIN